jgi:hypothetical protein
VTDPLAETWAGPSALTAWILASWLDPAENGIDVGDVSLLLGVVVVSCGIVLGTWRLMLRMLDKRIALIAGRLDERTKAIQGDANGSKSLPDVSRKLDLLIDHLGVDLPESLRVPD